MGDTENRKRLFDDPLHDDRSFSQQMADMGVEVVKKEANQLENIKWLPPRSGKLTALKNKISINKNAISIGKEVAEMLDDSINKKLQFAVAEYKNKKVLVIKNSKVGYKISVSSGGNSDKTGSVALVKKIVGNGLPLGIYRTQKAKGGIICIPEMPEE